MKNFEELKAKVDDILEDSSINSGSLINRGVTEIAGGMLSTLGDWITPPLPGLFTIGTITTSTTSAYVNMPDDFQRNLQLAVRATGQQIDISNSFIEFSETYPLLNRSGIISEVIEHGNQFYYQGIPTASEIVTLHFYRMPLEMVHNKEYPDGIPEHLHESLLVNYAAWKGSELIEDGIEGETPNTLKYMNYFMSALRTLELSIPDYMRGMFLK